jgi:hypothetical protein
MSQKALGRIPLQSVTLSLLPAPLKRHLLPRLVSLWTLNPTVTGCGTPRHKHYLKSTECIIDTPPHMTQGWTSVGKQLTFPLIHHHVHWNQFNVPAKRSSVNNGDVGTLKQIHQVHWLLKILKLLPINTLDCLHFDSRPHFWLLVFIYYRSLQTAKVMLLWHSYWKHCYNLRLV